MSAEIWRSEVIVYGFILTNLVATAIVLGLAWRKGMFKNLDDTMRTSLGLTESNLDNSKE